MSEDNERVLLTPEQAEAMLREGETVHNFVNPGPGMMIGCDFDRADAVAALKKAVQIELGGPACIATKHPIVVWDREDHYSFFEANMDKVNEFVASREKVAS